MSRADRTLARVQYALARATPAQLERMIVEMTTIAVAARMAKRPREEASARQMLALAERRRAEIGGANQREKAEAAGA